LRGRAEGDERRGGWGRSEGDDREGEARLFCLDRRPGEVRFDRLLTRHAVGIEFLLPTLVVSYRFQGRVGETYSDEFVPLEFFGGSESDCLTQHSCVSLGCLRLPLEALQLFRCTRDEVAWPFVTNGSSTGVGGGSEERVFWVERRSVVRCIDGLELVPQRCDSGQFGIVLRERSECQYRWMERTRRMDGPGSRRREAQGLG
jgi:hypothetical protein